jgi:hypothetical protein
MKVFISSIISSMEPFRAAAREAVEQLGHTPVLAEDLGAHRRVRRLPYSSRTGPERTSDRSLGRGRGSSCCSGPDLEGRLGYISNNVSRAGVRFSADFGGNPGVKLPRAGSTARALGRTIPLRPGRLEIYPFCSRTDGFEDFPRSAAAPPSTVRPPSY